MFSSQRQLFPFLILPIWVTACGLKKKLPEADITRDSFQRVVRIDGHHAEPVWHVRTNLQFAIDAVGSPATDACLAEIAGGWSGCSIKYGPCMTIVLRRDHSVDLHIRPLGCREQLIRDATWLVFDTESSGQTKELKVSGDSEGNTPAQ